MKILRNVGLLAGIHALALVLLVVLANPGCSSSRAQPPVTDAGAPAPAPAPDAAPAPAPGDNAAAAPAPAVSPIYYSPTRPGTPAAEALEAPPVTGVTPATTYTVVSGDSLDRIAKKNHIKSSELAAANHLRASGMLHVGQKLIIPERTASSAPSASAAAAPVDSAALAAAAPAGKAAAGALATTHTVRSGESLGAIARHYGVRIGDLAKANNITDPAKIHAGQVLTIPAGGRSAAAKASARSAAAAPASASAPEAAPAAAPSAEPAAAPVPAPAPDIPVIKIDDSSSSTTKP